VQSGHLTAIRKDSSPPRDQGAWRARALMKVAGMLVNRLSRVCYCRILFLLVTCLVVASLQACGSLPRQAAVPAPSTVRAVTPEAPRSRYWPELDMHPMLQDAAASDDRERAMLIRTGRSAEHLPPANFLAISGGSDLGAFGAGLLVGWSEHGQRPQFKVVTGISAGALIAPFAFLGSKYDAVLTTVCNSIRPRDIFHARNILAALTGDAFADNSPLAAVIAKYVTRKTLASIAREYAKGRLLLIGTTDLDAGQPVVWNMGEIASSKDPRALELFRKVMLASTAIPGIFPPVMIDVEVDGKRYQEMHVDGGVMTQVFLAPANLVQDLNNPSGSYARERHLYVIRNGAMEPGWSSVERRTTHIARQALETLIYAQGINDLYRLEVSAEREGEDFNVAYIDAKFSYPHPRSFAPDFVRHLFQYSNSVSAHGYPWRKALPDLSQPATK
jgi:predicted acylesterase/phospholipase RssA